MTATTEKRRSSMFRIIWPLFILTLLVGCASPGYKVTKEEFREQVRVLGVLPLLLDETSTIAHPARQEILELLHRQNAGKEVRLTSMLKEKKGFFDVRSLSGDPRQLYADLVRGSTLREKGSALYRQYQFDSATVRRLAENEAVDGLLILVFNGINREEKRWDRKSTSYLETGYNSIVVTATVLLPNGQVAWQHAGAPGEVFLALQYADFEEAHYNRTDEVKLKNITLGGLERTLKEPESTVFGRSSFPRLYQDLFNNISRALTPGLLNPLRRDS
jgi:hypothetical protein